MLLYQVSRKYSRGPETILAKFKDQADAKLFIHLKLEEDAGLKVSTTYLVYEGSDLIETFEGDGQSGSGSSSGSGTQKANAQVFSPSPLQVSPRPGGIPPSSFKDVEEDKRK